MFTSLLIANRGEITCRIIKTARRLGIRTVAVYSDVDIGALHVRMADEAVAIGPAPARDSYLNSERILDAARQTGADAIHPGYGFLAENAEFAHACTQAGYIFVGPPAAAIEQMGSKSTAKALMSAAGVPVVPGYFGADQSLQTLTNEAAEVGYPVLIKASAGGGGKGMRVVDRPEAFAAALESAQREARSAFGDDRVLLEKYLITPRHIEIQVFCDAHDNAVSLFERDCSLQRRHQKVLEEAPAPGLSEEQRAAMGAAAVAAARAVDYRNAGTVEFIVDPGGEFYFMEMNTRLQVEHPITELVTGQDLVEWQLHVAAGQPLPVQQQDLGISGHAVEVRLYAEDPERDFLPATGHLTHLQFPQQDKLVRIDAGVQHGDSVTVYYDPLLAKLIAWDNDRQAALTRLGAALQATELVGVTTNREFLSLLVAHPQLQAGAVDTGFIDRHRADLVPSPARADDTVLALAALHVTLTEREQAAARAEASSDPHSPWHHTSNWRLNEQGMGVCELNVDGARTAITLREQPDGYLLELPHGQQQAQISEFGQGRLVVNLDGRRHRAQITVAGRQLVVTTAGANYPLEMFDPDVAHAGMETAAGRLTSPMPGTVVKVLVATGDSVAQDTPLLVLEAMKMEHTITAPSDGTVTHIYFQEGDLVSSEGLEIIRIKT